MHVMNESQDTMLGTTNVQQPPAQLPLLNDTTNGQAGRVRRIHPIN